MANLFLFANLARSSLSGAISNTDVTMTVQAGGGAQFPLPSAGQQFALTLTDAATGLLKEVVYCTNRSGDTMTIVRGQEGYSALNWAPGDPVANLWTAGQAAAMQQSIQAQAQAPNYAVDVGTTNAYVGVYSPTISVPTAGMPLRLKIVNTNSGASTFNPGSGLASILTGSGSQLTGGELRSGMVVEFMWNGTNYELMAPAVSAVPAGTVLANAGTTTPGGFLVCDGSSKLRADFPDLFAAVGTTYGAADGSHFNLPNAQGRVIAGLDPSNTILSNPQVSPNGATLGAVGGAQTESASVTASGSTSGSLGVSGTTGGPSATVNPGTGGGSPQMSASPDHTHDFSTGTSGSLSVSATGSTASQTNVQPTLVLSYIIKAYN
jgi:microcystin-dependent protein